MEYFGAPATIYRVEKRPSSGIALCAWNNSSSLKNDPQVEYFCVPGTIHVWFIENRFSSHLWKYVVRLGQFIALKYYYLLRLRLKQFLYEKRYSSWNYVMCLEKFTYEKRPSSEIFLCARNNSCYADSLLLCWKFLIKLLFEPCHCGACLEQFIACII